MRDYHENELNLIKMTARKSLLSQSSIVKLFTRNNPIKKIFLSIVCVLLCLSLSACGKGDEDMQPAEEWAWQYNVDITCPWGEGGGADTTLQAFAKSFREISGTDVVIEHKSGSGGIAGMQYAQTKPADGYFYLLGTQSLLLMQISGETDYDVYHSIHPLCRLVYDCNLFVTASDAPRKSYEEVHSYALDHPGKLRCGLMSLMGLDSACANTAFGDTLELVPYQDGQSMLDDVANGVIDLAICGPGEASEKLSAGRLHILISCTEEPVTINGYDEPIPCAGELGIECFYGPGRGIFYIDGTPEEAIRAFERDAKATVESEEFQRFLHEQNLNLRPGWLGREEYQIEWDNEYDELSAIFSEGGAK